MILSGFIPPPLHISFSISFCLTKTAVTVYFKLCNDLTVAFWLFPAAVIHVSQPTYPRIESEEIRDLADEVSESRTGAYLFWQLNAYAAFCARRASSRKESYDQGDLYPVTKSVIMGEILHVTAHPQIFGWRRDRVPQAAGVGDLHVFGNTENSFHLILY